MNSTTLAEDPCPTCQGSGFLTQEQYAVAYEIFTGRPSDSEVDEVIIKDRTIYTKSGKRLSRQYDAVGDFHEGLAKVYLNRLGGSGFVNTKGEEVTPLKYDWIEDFYDGFAKAELNGKYGFVNTKAEEVVPLEFQDSDLDTQLTSLKLGGDYDVIQGLTKKPKS